MTSPADPAPPAARDLDVLVIGAGPAGLFAVFELGLREIAAEVVDALPFAGGQCVELYGDTPIYDIPAVPRCTGRELTERLLQQVAPFRPALHLGRHVSALARTEDGRWRVEAGPGLTVTCRAVVLAAGVGAFLPRKPKLAGLEALEGDQVLFHADPQGDFAGEAVLVAGAGERALQLAATLATRIADGDPRAPSQVALLHRRDVFDADDATVATFRAHVEAGRLRFVAGMPSSLALDAAGRLAGVTVLAATGDELTVPADRLVVLQGLSPRLGPLAEWGLALEHRHVAVDTATFATSLPGVFAIGDVVHYPGKQRLILSAFHEATLAAAGVATHLAGAPVGPLEYTTSSARIHRLLGV